MEKDNNKINKVDDDDAVNGAHKIIKDRDIHGIGSDSNSNSSNITSDYSNITSNSSSANSHHDSIDIGSNNISNIRFDDGCQPIQQPIVEFFPKLPSNDEVVAVSTPLSESSSSLSPQETPVSSSSSSSSSSSPSITTKATAASSTDPVVEIPLINPKNVTTIGSTIHYAEQKYEDFEANLMKSINESNQRRFRFLLIGTLLTIIWISTVFGARIRKMLTEETAGLAKETLENESLKIQTQVMMMMMMMICRHRW
jgi:hypothetical protein